MMDKVSVDVVIPVYKPDKRFDTLIKRLKNQTYPVGQIIIMNTERSYWKEEMYSDMENLQVYHVKKKEYNHGGTRNEGASHSQADIIIFMTQDAVPADEFLVERLLAGFSRLGSKKEPVSQVYARQLPEKDCRLIERLNREFNYPKEGCVKTKEDLEKLGIKTYFSSNVCCAYKRDIFVKQGGFCGKTIFNEDMIYAAGVIQAGYAIVYEAEARVIHSHNFSGRQQFSRNFDLAVSQADHPEVFDGLPSEGEGIRMVRKTAKILMKTGHGGQIPALIFGSGCKYLGYRLGKQYRILPMWLVRRCTSSPDYWSTEGR